MSFWQRVVVITLTNRRARINLGAIIRKYKELWIWWIICKVLSKINVNLWIIKFITLWLLEGLEIRWPSWNINWGYYWFYLIYKQKRYWKNWYKSYFYQTNYKFFRKFSRDSLSMRIIHNIEVNLIVFSIKVTLQFTTTLFFLWVFHSILCWANNISVTSYCPFLTTSSSIGNIYCS